MTSTSAASARSTDESGLQHISCGPVLRNSPAPTVHPASSVTVTTSAAPGRVLKSSRTHPVKISEPERTAEHRTPPRSETMITRRGRSGPVKDFPFIGRGSLAGFARAVVA
ncbi:MAG: hypothetical protein L0H64_16910 [Pseudonocardia sp.]|nr:hypothetical protein [Pseudonocardia sp.]